MTKAQEMYNRMMEIFIEHTINDEFCDVDMFRVAVTKGLFIETDPQDIDEDDYLIFQEALILLVRDDLLLDYFGLTGLCILQSDLIMDGEHYYINKELFHG